MTSFRGRRVSATRPSRQRCPRAAPRWCAPGVRLDSPRQPSSTGVPMRLIGLAVVLAVSLALAPLSAEAQAGKVYRIGILGEKASDPSEARMWQTFQLGL